MHAYTLGMQEGISSHSRRCDKYLVKTKRYRALATSYLLHRRSEFVKQRTNISFVDDGKVEEMPRETDTGVKYRVACSLTFNADDPELNAMLMLEADVENALSRYIVYLCY